MLTSSRYINSDDNLVPENKIVVVPHNKEKGSAYLNIIEPLKNNPKRDWFTPHFYYCLPLNIGNQYGFVIKSLYDFTLVWTGKTDKDSLHILMEDEPTNDQHLVSQFGCGILTIQNDFTLRTSPGINIMTIQPPNMFIPGTCAMTGVIECDNIRRDFTFNLKVTIPNYKIVVKKGDALGAFIPIQRNFVDNFDIEYFDKFFSEETIDKELSDSAELGRQRNNEDRDKVHRSGRKYFNGEHANGEKYKSHQKRIKI
jgi:hypothetical protein